MRIGTRATEVVRVRRATWTTAGLVVAAALTLSSGNPPASGTDPDSQSSPPAPENLVQDFRLGIALQWQRDKPLIVEGQVLDVADKPLEGADVAVLASLTAVGGLQNPSPIVLGQSTTDANGTFRSAMPSLPQYQVQSLYAVARRAGSGLGIQELNADSLHQTRTFRLDQEQVVHGRVIGPDGQPAAGVKLDLRTFGELWSEYRLEITMGPEPKQRPKAWPEPPVTDAQGWFALKGMPQSKAEKLWLDLVIDDPRYAPFDRDLYFGGYGQRKPHLEVRNASGDELAIQLEAPTFVRGKVSCQDTKQPIANTWLSVVAGPDFDVPPADSQCEGVWVKSDGQGRFEARMRPCKYVVIYAYPPSGLPYLAWGQTTKLDEGPNPHEVNIEVPRGILLRGKVVEEGSGKGVSAAGVEYQVRKTKDYFTDIIYWAAEYRRILTRDDGAFEMVVAPGVGNLMVKAPNPDFVTRYVTIGDLQRDQPGGFFYLLEGLAKIDPKPGMDTVEVTIPLRGGLTAQCHVVGPQGQLVDKVVLLTPIDPLIGFSATNAPHDHPVFNGSFELCGCDPAKARRIYVLDNKNQLGATVDVDAVKLHGSLLTVGLLPCGSATVRFVDQDGHPWANCHPAIGVQLVFLKCPVSSFYYGSGHLGWQMFDLDHKRFPDLQTDAEGRVTVPTLIPEAPYILSLYDGRPEPNPKDTKAVERWLKETHFEFSVQAGQTLDLGAITMIRPESAK